MRNLHWQYGAVAPETILWLRLPCTSSAWQSDWSDATINVSESNTTTVSRWHAFSRPFRAGAGLSSPS